jgi:protein subunit release factor A
MILLQQNLIKYYQKVTNMALTNLKNEKTFQFKKMLTNHSLLKFVESHYEKITNSKEAKKQIKEFMAAMNNMTKIAKDDYNKVLKQVKATDDPILKQKLLSDYAEKGISGFVAKNGAVWSIDTYSNMYATHFNNELVRLSVIENVDDNDELLISSHNCKCEKCKPWENKVIKKKDIDKAKNEGLFHVRCKHFVTKYSG